MPPYKNLSRKTSDLKVPGFKASGISCGIKKTGKKDLALLLSDVPAKAAGVFTTNKVKAAPVILDIKRLKKGVSRGVIINSGNANACTGKDGYKDSERMASAVEDALGSRKGSIFVCSTGVIGVRLPVEKIERGAHALIKNLSYDGFQEAARAIMTTDAFPKTAALKARINGKTVTLSGFAKGAGMICPNMATMLAFIATDAEIGTAALRRALRSAVDLSFNSILVDNDTSTNDTVLAFANGLSGCGEIKVNSEAFRIFSGLLNEASLKLAHMVVKDGEGATRFIEINITGAASAGEARTAARSIAESLLVKTAFFGGDPNWGRIMAALGKAGIKMKEERVGISFNGVPVVRNGLDTGNEARAAKAIKVKDVSVEVKLNAGRSSAKVWTTDLSYDYVRINSSYRT